MDKFEERAYYALLATGFTKADIQKFRASSSKELHQFWTDAVNRARLEHDQNNKLVKTFADLNKELGKSTYKCFTCGIKYRSHTPNNCPTCDQ